MLSKENWKSDSFVQKGNIIVITWNNKLPLTIGKQKPQGDCSL